MDNPDSPDALAVIDFALDAELSHPIVELDDLSKTPHAYTERERACLIREVELTHLANRVEPRDGRSQVSRFVLMARPSDFQLVGQSPFWRHLAQKIRSEVLNCGGAFQVNFVWESPEAQRLDELRPEFLDDLQSGRVQGVLALGISSSNVREIEAAGVPLVGFAVPARNAVCLDSAAIMKDGVQALIDRGCRRIGFWRPARILAGEGEDSAFLQWEAKNFRAEIQSRGLEYFPDLVRSGNLDRGPALFAGGVTLEEEGYYTALQVIGAIGSPKPDGLLIMDDMVTRGALAAMRYIGTHLNPKIQVATLSNKGIPVLRDQSQNLVCLQVDPAEIARAMVYRLQSLMDGFYPANPTFWVTSQVLNWR